MQSRVGTTLIATAEIMARELDYKRKKIVVDNRLYPGDVDKMLTIIHKLDDALQRVMLFGHNPALTELAHRLSSDIVHMPTCAVAKFKFRSKSWSSVGKSKLARVALDYPRKRKS